MSEDFRARLMRDGSVPLTEFGKQAFGLSAEAARRAGDIPSVKIGGQYFVPCAKARRLLGLEEMQAA